MDAGWAALCAFWNGGNPTVVGVFHYARSDRAAGHTVVPFDERMTQHILIPAGQELPVANESATPHRVLGKQVAPDAVHESLEGLVVDVEITSWPTPTRPPVGRVIEVLGSLDDFGVDVEMMIRKHQLRGPFRKTCWPRRAPWLISTRRKLRTRQDFSLVANCHHRRRDGP